MFKSNSSNKINLNNFTINEVLNNKLANYSDNILFYKDISNVNYKNSIYINNKIFSEDLYRLNDSNIYNKNKLLDISDFIFMKSDDNFVSNNINKIISKR